MNTVKYSFEDLEVWQRSVSFCEKAIDLVENVVGDRKHYRLIENLESSAASIAMNIAEGKGRFSKKEFIRFLYISRGSLNEVITLLTIFHRKQWIRDADLQEMRSAGDEIGKMLSGLIAAVKRSI
jgi:four helix bundle protein